MEYALIGGIGLCVILLIILILKPAKKDNYEEITAEIQNQKSKIDIIDSKLTDLKLTITQELKDNRSESSQSLKEMRDIILKIQNMNSQLSDKMNETLTKSIEKLQQSNEKKLDQMRQTVDEKLTATLSQRLDSSFKMIGERLENVYKSLGEMKELAGGVSDLQRVLTNVKARGTWAEVQLGSILEQTLTHEQYECNAKIKNDGTLVEFAVKIPSKEDDSKFILLPIDSKFPQEAYLRLSDAAANANKEAVDAAVKELETIIKNEAKKISSLYIDVPTTTDFAIMFLPTEGLYAEVLRIPGLCEEIHNKYRIMMCGPTTITAFLNTLRMGFRTIALNKHASQVWKVLGAAKAQYANFETLLMKARKKIDEVGETLDSATKRNNIIQKKLRTVESIEPQEVESILEFQE